ncbi:MAG: hypothetical protein WAV20_25145, partial [Blastocatellia bacterium]
MLPRAEPFGTAGGEAASNERGHSPEGTFPPRAEALYTAGGEAARRKFGCGSHATTNSGGALI